MEDAASSPELAGRCLTCDYPLRGLPDNRCPECGRPFDPTDPRTMNLGRPLTLHGRRLLKPPAWPMYSAVGVGAALAVWANSVPLGNFGLLALAFLVWCITSLAWLVRFASSLGAAWYYRQPTFKRGRIWLRWLIVPMVAGVIIALVQVDAPLYVRFRLSRPAMERLAQQVIQSPPNAPGNRWVGLYYATEIEAIPGGMEFRVRGSDGFLLWGGFAYSPTSQPVSEPPDIYYTEFWGDWYVWWFHF